MWHNTSDLCLLFRCDCLTFLFNVKVYKLFLIIKVYIFLGLKIRGVTVGIRAGGPIDVPVVRGCAGLPSKGVSGVPRNGSHIGWRGERSTLYKGVDTPPW